MNYRKPKILIVDNYDSFTFNLVQILKEEGSCDFDVAKNDRVEPVSAGKYDGFLFSPGPGIPEESPVMAELLDRYAGTRGFLGVCLGHQAIAEKFRLKLDRLDTVRHGVKTRVMVTEPDDYLFRGVPTEFDAGLYHSWGVYHDSSVMYEDLGLRVTAMSDDGIIMSLAHTRFNVRGVQFHPESYMTEYGPLFVRNWIDSLV